MLRIFRQKVNWFPSGSALLLAFVSLPICVCASTAHAQRNGGPALMTSDAVEPLKKKGGYALLQLDVSGVAPSLEFALLERRTDKTPAQGAKAPRRVKPMVLDLTGRDKGFYLLQLPAGWYQVTRVNAPYYDLPFQMTTDGEAAWRFVVYEDKTSYVGLLSIAKERSLRSVDIVLRNRIATTFEDIEVEFAPMLDTAPLVMGRALRDDFLSDLRSTGAQQ